MTNKAENKLKRHGWMKIEKGTWDDEAVRFGGRWWAYYYKEGHRMLDGVPTRTFYRQDFDENGCRETHLIVGEDGYCKRD